MEVKLNSFKGLLIVSIFAVLGFIFLYSDNCFNFNNYNNISDYLNDHIFTILFSLFFISISLMCWISFIRNYVFKDKKDIVYLLDIDDNSDLNYQFVTKSGKKYYYKGFNLKQGRFYYVIRSKDMIKNIIGESLETFNLKEIKDRYWLYSWMDMYSPFGKFKRVFILPILYFIFIISVVSVIFQNGLDIILSICMALFALYLIIYDIIYKVKLRKNNGQYMDDSNFIKTNDNIINGVNSIKNIVMSIFAILILLGVLFFVSYLFIKSDVVGRFIVLPFILACLVNLLYYLAKIFNSKTLDYLFKKSYLIFIILFFIYILIGTIISENLLAKILLIPIICILIIFFYKKIKESQKKKK